MSVPLIITSPLSGRSRPSRCLRKTDLPPPLRPMITVMEPSGTSRSTPRRTGWPANDFVSPRTLITGSPRLRLRRPRLQLARPRSQARLALGCGSHGRDHRLASPSAAARTAAITGSPRPRLRLAPPRSQARLAPRRPPPGRAPQPAPPPATTRPAATPASPSAAARTAAITGSPRPRLQLARPRSQARLALPRSREDRAQEVVPDEDQHGGEDDGLGGGARDALGAVADVEPLVGRHPRDDGPEGQRLPEASHDVVEIYERPHLTEVRPLAEAEQLHADQVSTEDAHDVEEGRNHRTRHDAGPA